MQKGIEITVNYITNECFKHLIRIKSRYIFFNYIKEDVQNKIKDRRFHE